MSNAMPQNTLQHLQYLFDTSEGYTLIEPVLEQVLTNWGGGAIVQAISTLIAGGSGELAYSAFCSFVLEHQSSDVILEALALSICEWVKKDERSLKQKAHHAFSFGKIEWGRKLLNFTQYYSKAVTLPQKKSLNEEVCIRATTQDNEESKVDLFVDFITNEDLEYAQQQSNTYQSLVDESSQILGHMLQDGPMVTHPSENNNLIYTSNSLEPQSESFEECSTLMDKEPSTPYVERALPPSLEESEIFDHAVNLDLNKKSSNLPEFIINDSDLYFSEEELLGLEFGFDELEDNNELDHRLSAEERAYQKAASFIVSVEPFNPYWTAHHHAYLHQVFLDNPHGATYQALFDEAKSGLKPEELKLALYLRYVWKNSDYYWISINKEGEWLLNQQIFSWKMALHVIRSFAEYPQEAELGYFLEKQYELWIENSRLQRIYPAFIKYLWVRSSNIPSVLPASIDLNFELPSLISPEEYGDLGCSDFHEVDRNRILFDLGVI